MTDQTKALTKYDQFKLSIRSDTVRERFEVILKEKSESFLSSLLSVVANDDALQKCDTGSILTAAAKAAILDLPVEKSLGFAWIVPFKTTAEFILGYKGYIQLALRTAFYEVINATPVYEGEEITENRLTGEIKLNGNRTGDEVIGFAAYFRLKNGFEKFVYKSVEDVHKHAKRYSKSYSYKSSAWQTNFNAMGLKTVIRELLGKWGLLSIQMQDADVDIDFPSGDNGRLTEMEDMVVPDFEDVVEGEARDIDQTESQPELLPDDKGDVHQAIVDAKLSVNLFAAKAAFSYCTVDCKTTEDVIAWMRLYRGWRALDKKAPEAADLANKGKTPK